jgi:hypothetical protein
VSEPNTDLVAFRHRPANVAEAMELAVRIDAVKAWLSDLRESVTKGYLTGQAEAIEQATGAAFRAPVTGLGLVYRTDPQPRPRISNQELFGRWYVQSLLDDDPDRDGEQLFVQFDERVGRRLTATANPVDLIRFVNEVAAAPRTTTGAEAVADLAVWLADQVRVDVEWLVGEATLTDLLAGKLHPVDSGARLYITPRGNAVADRATGEQVPGVLVDPAGNKTLTVKPDPDAKLRIRAELDRLLGPAELQGEDEAHDQASA